MNWPITLDDADASAGLSGIREMRAVILAHSVDAHRIAVGDLMTRLAAVERVTSISDILADLARRPDMVPRTVLIADLGAMGGIGTAFDTLRGFRMLYPEMVVVLIAPNEGGADFGRTRLPICDVTLGPEVTGDDLDLALFAGLRNNAVWRARLAEASDRDLDAV